ncbi:DUF1963 domain-containing protein [Acuticoccus sp. M5D2P5]|uniref:DUF1963 domain-containing protein n=1 Tax=Acuticoccus kalidii TaxID=2910977 RepID=UPI001F45AE50|nr:DUF1963 domain-containing protein [Acuticoccus kalidii]MCF3935961.1 DUF1963 domain-containing protein [Acuticoccus kalidii]
MNFADHDALRDSLAAAGLRIEAGRIIAHARPVIAFARRHVAAGMVPFAASRLAGDPDLADPSVWPSRPPAPDLADAQRRVKLRYAQWFGDNPSLLASMNDRADAAIAALSKSMPLNFVGQLNFETLGAEPGFDPALPRHGMLSIFNEPFDFTGAYTRFLYREDAGAGETVPFPEALAALSDATSGEGAFADRSFVGALHPISGVSVPEHFMIGGVSDPRLAGWVIEPTHELTWDQADPMLSEWFGDQLGGWPQNIQGRNAEDDAAATYGVPGVSAYGRTPLFHLFSYGGEAYTDTRSLLRESDGDGNIYLFVLAEALARRDFGRVFDTVQMT